MATENTLPATLRTATGKGPARQLRMKGKIPAVCYGPHDKPLHVAIDPEQLRAAIATPLKFNTVITMKIEGSETRTVLFKDFEKDPLDGSVLHADFVEVRMDQETVVNVPVVLVGKPVGVTEGGILQQVSRTLPVRCKPAQIPEKIEVDVSALQIAESLHISDIKAPAGVQFVTTKIKNATIAVVNIPEKEEVAKPAVAAVPGAEGEAAAPGAEGAAPGAAPAAGAAPAPGAAPAAGAAKGAEKPAGGKK